MSPIAKETAEILESLPAGKARTLLEFARYLAGKSDEEAWNRRFSSPKHAKKLRAMADKALAEIRSGKADLLNPDRM